MAVGGSGGMDGHALCIAHVGKVAEELQAFDKLPAGFRPALDAEAQDRAGTFGEVFLGALVIGMAFQARVFDPADLGVLLQPFSHYLGVMDVQVESQAECFDALAGQEAVERALRNAIVAQNLHARLDDEGGT